MGQACEVKICISNSEQKYTQSFLCYERISVSHEDPKLEEMVNQSIANFKGNPDDVKVKITYVW